MGQGRAAAMTATACAFSLNLSLILGGLWNIACTPACLQTRGQYSGPWCPVWEQLWLWLLSEHQDVKCEHPLEWLLCPSSGICVHRKGNWDCCGLGGCCREAPAAEGALLVPHTAHSPMCIWSPGCRVAVSSQVSEGRILRAL